jgi:hypothetical protein
MGFDWPIGFLFGAIISPPDAVAPLAIARGMEIPWRILVVLEGEGLANDAAALILYRFAVAAVGAGVFSLGEAAPRLMSRVRLERTPRSRDHRDGARAANLHSWLAAYGAVGARRELRRRLHEFLCVIGRIFELGVLELHFSFENLAVDFDKPQGAVEIDVRSRPL